uniref:Synaptotagmin-3 n=1 Tax=Cryptocotyle lingua TaxID=66766 RepID=A0A7U0TIY2_9TREM|nr:synaptotagmin-3 [Cryptocotyle lingua]
MANDSLQKLAAAFHVENTGLAVFILILICLLCATVLVLIGMVIYYYLKRRVDRKSADHTFRKRMQSVYWTEVPEKKPVRGQYGKLSYSIQYEGSTGKLVVIVLHANIEKYVSDNGLPNSYVIVKLASEKYGKLQQIGESYKTKVQHQTIVPTWNHQVTFDVTKEDMDYTVILFELLDYDSTREDKSIGRLVIHLSALDVATFTGTALERTACLQAGEPKFHGIGELSIGLSYNKVLERLDCNVYEARHLQVREYMYANNHQKISVQVELRCNQNSLGSFETQAKTDWNDPYFNEKFTFRVPEKHLQDSKIVCQLQSRGKRGKKGVIASFTIGPTIDSTAGAKHWEEVIQDSPRSHVMWHTLIPTNF